MLEFTISPGFRVFKVLPILPTIPPLAPAARANFKALHFLIYGGCPKPRGLTSQALHPIPMFESPIGARPTRRHSVAYNQLMKAFGHAGKVDQVLKLLREMKESGLNPNVFCYNTAINALVLKDHRIEAEALFEEMISSGARPNVASYNILVKLHSCYSFQFDKGLAGRIEKVSDVLDVMSREKCPPSVWTFTPIVQGYCLEGKIDEARWVMGLMEKEHCPPNVVTYNILVEALCKIGRFDQVEKILDESILKGWKPNVVTYNTYMNGLCKWGKTREALGQFEVMCKNGLCPTDVSLNIYLDCLCRESRVLEAKYLLDRSSRDVGVAGYNIVMSRLSSVGRWWDVLKLFVDMVKKGIEPNTRTFNIFIHCLCKVGNLRLAKHLFERGGFGANVITYNTLIHWFSLERNTKEIQALVSKMVVENISPDIFTYYIWINGLCRERKFSEATHLFLESIAITSRKVEELFYLLEEMARQGFVFDAFAFDGLKRVKLADPDIVSNPTEYQKIAQSMAELDEVVSLYRKFKDCEKQIEEAKALAKEDGDDPEMGEMIAYEIETLSNQMKELEEKLKVRMYQKYSELNSWKFAPVSCSEAEKGGYKTFVMEIKGKWVYSKLKYESGVHRVQRVPQTETQG
ncbi:hypothetical protein J5N97_018168 [Dioscorea zingiberensis]|uniref:Peptide chain release factor domain-containing protein n=1 Tax=Dioscorea zingiberensis TaxID=325984 RepID=A0A9D5HH45_9LILI|nr:hypothetical protein J5N97_018168 [Dioscorea zingiberensis]